MLIYIYTHIYIYIYRYIYVYKNIIRVCIYFVYVVISCDFQSDDMVSSLSAALSVVYLRIYICIYIYIHIYICIYIYLYICIYRYIYVYQNIICIYIYFVYVMMCDLQSVKIVTPSYHTTLSHITRHDSMQHLLLISCTWWYRVICKKKMSQYIYHLFGVCVYVCVWLQSHIKIARQKCHVRAYDRTSKAIMRWAHKTRSHAHGRVCVMLQCAAVCCSVLQCVAVCCSVVQCVAVCCSVLQCAAVCCSVLQCVAVCCSVLQCVAVCCSVLQCVVSSDLAYVKLNSKS